MASRYNAEELNKLKSSQLVEIILTMQEQQDKLNENLEKLIEAIRVADQQRFGRRTERLDQICGQLSLFNEAEAYAEEAGPEPDGDEVVITVSKRKKQVGKREEDFKDLPHEPHDHKLTDEQLDAFFGKGCWRRMTPDKYIRVRCQPAVYTVEDHTVEVAVGTKGDHQDEFLRGDRPKDLLRNSVVTPSLMAAIMNAKYVNAVPLYRLENEFRYNGLNIPRQNMANWVIRCSEKYFGPLISLMKEELLSEDVTQCDETTVQVINDNDPDDPADQKGSPGHNNYMWIHHSCEFNRERPIILYEYQRGRGHEIPLEYYKGYKGILMTDGLQQYHKLEDLLGLTSANCWAHARRDFADAIKAIGKTNPNVIKRSLAYQALEKIKTIFKLEEPLKELSAEERLKERQKTIASLVDEYFKWVKERLADTSVLPKGKTAEGLNYSVNQEKYLRVFLTNGNVPLDNSACERSAKNFAVGRKNWLIIDSVKGAKASADVYSICETAKANNLNPYYYLEHLLTELPKLVIDKEGNMDTTQLDRLLPWSDSLPEKCHKPRR